MLKDISKYNCYGRSQFVRLRGKYIHQCTHCALVRSKYNNSMLAKWGLRGGRGEDWEGEIDTHNPATAALGECGNSVFSLGFRASQDPYKVNKRPLSLEHCYMAPEKIFPLEKLLKPRIWLIGYLLVTYLFTMYWKKLNTLHFWIRGHVPGLLI